LEQETSTDRRSVAHGLPRQVTLSNRALRQRHKPYSISLTTFIDFVTSSNVRQRLTVGRKAATEISTEYSIKRDFYKGPREAFQAAAGKKVEMDLSRVPTEKRGHYQEVVTGWNRFIGRKTFESGVAKHREWVSDDLIVRVNPELALKQDGRLTYVKIHFKAEPIRKDQSDLIYQLMHEMLIVEPHEGIGILDARRARLIPIPASIPNAQLGQALIHEASYLSRFIDQHLSPGA